MKIAMITDFFWPSIGGLEASTAYLARSLQARHDVEILTPDAPGPAVERSRAPAADLGVRRFRAPEGPPYAAMFDHLARTRPEAACFFGFSDSFTDAHLDFLARVRRELVRTVTFKVPTRAELELYVNGEARRRLFLRADRFVCLNGSIREALVERGALPERIVDQPNGVPADLFVPASPDRRRALRAELGLDDRVTFVFTGRFAARKRVDLLARAFSAVPEAALLLVGYFDDRFDAGARVDPGTGSNVTIRGPTLDVLPYLQAADAFVSASLAEGMSNALLEALSCGLPAVVSDIPGHRELVRPGENGRLFDPGDSGSLVRAIRDLVRDRAGLPGLGARARQTVTSGFTIERVAATYERLLAGG